MRVIFFGALCAFSTAPLQLLLEAGHDLCAVMISSGQSISGRPITLLSPPQLTPIPIVDTAASPSIVSIAWQHQIPIYHINRLVCRRDGGHIGAAAGRCRLRRLLP